MTMKAAVIKKLKQGLACQQSGNLEDAERRYLQVLERDPSASDAWHLMGRLLLLKRQFARAQGCLAKAIQLRPDLPAYHATLGDIMAARKHLHEAALCYQEAVRRDPRFTPALVNLGNVWQCEGRLEDACGAYVRALESDPESAEAWNNLGNTLRALGKEQDGIACYREALRLHPGLAETPVNLAAACLARGNPKEAEEWSRLALEWHADLPQALSNLSLSLLGQERVEDAEAFARRAIAAAPESGHLHTNLGSILVHQKRWREAEQACRRAVELKPGHPEAIHNLGVVFQFTDRLEEAVAQYRQVVERQPENADAWTNLGIVRGEQGRPDEALQYLEKALRHDPIHAKAHFCHSLELLGRGRWTEGLAEYEWRWQVMRPGRAAAGPLWDGGPLDGRTILLYVEQGLGDTIQFSRYIPLVAERGGQVIVESQPAAAPIVRAVAGVSHVISPADPLPAYDVQAPLLSLPRIFGTTAEDPPGHTPYVSFDRERAAQMDARLGARRGLRVGLAWAGNPENGGDRRRSVPLGTLLPLRAVDGVDWLSLHIGEASRAAVQAAGGWIREVLSEDGGLVELAALIECLDLVISVDTMPAHLAGALARPVWNLLCATPDWRWLRAGERTPWYPTMRLFRQSAPGAWGPVIERVVQELSNSSAQASSKAIRYEELKAGGQSALEPASRLRHDAEFKNRT